MFGCFFRTKQQPTVNKVQQTVLMGKLLANRGKGHLISWSQENHRRNQERKRNLCMFSHLPFYGIGPDKETF